MVEQVKAVLHLAKEARTETSVFGGGLQALRRGASTSD